MHYLEVLVGDTKYHGSTPLTYSSTKVIPLGAIVTVELRGRRALGLVSKDVKKPTFTVKPISYYDADHKPVPTQSVALLEWLQTYYPAPLGITTRQFMPATTSTAKRTSTVAHSLKRRAITTQLPPLTTEQKDVLSKIPQTGLTLLHGATGTGKTRVYIDLAKQAMDKNRSSIILTPEIGLTAQLVSNFEAQFPDRVIVFHSRLTPAQRRDLWYQVLDSVTPIVAIGPRSALFLPVANIGLIVIDEAHEAAYKNESAPHYMTSRVAAQLAKLHDALLVMGSATPSVEDYFVATKKERPILRMTTPATNQASTATKLALIDMKDRSNFQRSTMISTVLEQAIAAALGQHEQSLLFLNRRGTAKVVLCSTCGWQVLCPRCDLPLTYHGDLHLLRCHACNYGQALPQVCPVCGNSDILLKSFGTKAVVNEIERLFPSAHVSRFDTDLTKQEQLEQNMSALQSGKIDIIVGTQVIAKGLDLPHLSVVGVLNADTSLWIPDYTANERTYQLLSQVIGRVGRGHRGGTAIVQTYSPENETISAALKNDWTLFYQHELAERQTYQFPPFCYVLRLICSRSSQAKAQQTAQKLHDLLAKNHPHITVEGPAPTFHNKKGHVYSWQLVVKSRNRGSLLAIIKTLPSGWLYDIDPSTLL